MLDKAKGITPLGATLGSGFCCDTLRWFCCYVGAPFRGRGALGWRLSRGGSPMILSCSQFAFHVVELHGHTVPHFGEGNLANWHAEFTWLYGRRIDVLFIFVFLDDIGCMIWILYVRDSRDITTIMMNSYMTQIFMTVVYTAYTISWFWADRGGDSSAVRSQLVDVKDWPFPLQGTSPYSHEKIRKSVQSLARGYVSSQYL